MSLNHKSKIFGPSKNEEERFRWSIKRLVREKKLVVKTERLRCLPVSKEQGPKGLRSQWR